MIRYPMLAGAVLALSVSAGCNNAADTEAKADKTQAQADAKIKAAQAEADKKLAEVQASLAKMREDYRHETVEKLITIDMKIADLEARARATTGKTRANLEATLKRIRAARDRFTADFKALEATSAAAWDQAKAGLDKELADMQSLVDDS
jgi:hypothetical protein